MIQPRRRVVFGAFLLGVLAIGPSLSTGRTGATPPATLTYTFDSLTSTVIHGQDNWVTVDNVHNPGGVTHWIGALGGASVSAHNTTKALYFDWEGAGYGSRSTRIDDSNFSTMPIPDSGIAVIEFEAHRAFWGTWFRMGHDTNANGDLANDELGLHLQLRQAGSTWKSSLKLGTQTYTSTTALGNYGKYQLVLDRTLGTASLWYKNMTAGTDWAVLDGLANVATGFTTDSTVNDPRTWNGFGVHGEGRTSVFDNLSFRLVDVSSRSLTFAATNRGAQRQTSVDLSGLYVNQPLTATATGDFRFTNGTQTTQVSAGASLGVVYAPSTHGSHTGTVEFSSPEMVAPLTVALSGRTTPEIVSFSTTSPNGTYTTGQTIDITATSSVPVTAGSQVTVTLDTGATVVLTAASPGTSLTGTYTVAAGQNSADLSVVSFDAGATTDAAGNAVSSSSLPIGTDSLSGAHAIVISTPSGSSSQTTTTTTSPSTTSTVTQPASTPETGAGSGDMTSVATRRGAAPPSTATIPAPVISTTTTTVAPTTTISDLAPAKPGELVALVDGRAAVGGVTNDEGTVIIEVADIVVRVRCTREDGSLISPTADGELRFEPGSTMAMSVSGFLADSVVDVEMRSTPTPLGSLRADADGNGTAEFAVPDSLTIGDHRLVVAGNDQAGRSVTVGLGMSLRAADDPAPIGLIAGIVLVAGLAAILVPAEAVRRRRRRL